MRKVAILYICTGRYAIFWDEFFRSVECNFLKDCHIEYFVFTDGEIRCDNERVTIIKCEHLGWPFDTLMRFHMFSEVRSLLEPFDFLFYMNANMSVVSPVTDIILPVSEDYVGLLHPFFYTSRRLDLPYEYRRRSLASMGWREGYCYYMGAFYGGKAKPFLDMAEQLSRNIEKDLKKRIIAIWWDESHLNRYFWKHDTVVKRLIPSYGYPEEMDLPFEPKIVIRNKNNFGGHSFLRQMSQGAPIESNDKR